MTKVLPTRIESFSKNISSTNNNVTAKGQHNHGEHSNGGSEGSHRDAAMQSLVSSRELPDEVSTVGSATDDIISMQKSLP